MLYYEVLVPISVPTSHLISQVSLKVGGTCTWIGSVDDEVLAPSWFPTLQLTGKCINSVATQ